MGGIAVRFGFGWVFGACSKVIAYSQGRGYRFMHELMVFESLYVAECYGISMVYGY
jgi:hypothetical protein